MNFFLKTTIAAIVVIVVVLLILSVTVNKKYSQKVSNVSMKQLEYGVYGECIWTEKHPFVPRGAVVPDNILQIIAKSERFQKLDKRIIEARLLYVFSVDADQTGNRRGIPLGLVVETVDGVEIKKMYEFDCDELDFVESALKSISGGLD